MNLLLRRDTVLVAIVLASVFAGATNAQRPDVDEIVRRAFEREEANEAKARQYTFHRREEQRSLDRAGSVKSANSKTFDVTLLFGEEYQRLIAINDQPLSAKRDEKEQREFEQRVEKVERQTPEQRRRRDEKIKKRREEDRVWVAEMQELFEFSLSGEETVRGIETWVIQAEPRSDYEPKQRRARFLKKTRGTFWIAKDDYGWVKLEAETLDTISFGLFLFRLPKGSTFGFEQRKLEEGVWLTNNFRVKFDGRAGLVKKLRREIVGEYSNYRKFSAESELIVDDSPVVVTESASAVGH